MVTRSATPETGETVCPACGAGIRTSPAARRRRVRCPKCREVVFIESARVVDTEAVPDNAPSPAAVAPAPVAEMTPETRTRLESLEARVEMLEAALRELTTAARTAPTNAPQRKLVWVSATPGRAPTFSPEQDDALFRNLGSIHPQTIAIRTPRGDTAARTHAEWFKSVFERAGWNVLGPDEIAPEIAAAGMTLAVPELPVAREAAATYLSLKAAGFEAMPVLDRTPRSESGEKTAMALTVPPVKTP